MLLLPPIKIRFSDNFPGGIDDLCLKYFVEAGAMAVRRCKKVDLKRIPSAQELTLSQVWQT